MPASPTGDLIGRSLHDPAYIDAVEAFDAHLRLERGASEHTRRAYVGDVCRLLATFEGPDGRGLPLTDIEAGNLREWVLTMSRTGSSPATTARRIASVRRFFGQCLRSGRIAQDPSTRLRTPKKPSRLPTVLQQEHAARVLDGADGRTDSARTDRPPASAVLSDVSDAMEVPEATKASEPSDPTRSAVGLRDAALLELLYATGLRVSELVGLDLDDVDGRRASSRCWARAARCDECRSARPRPEPSTRGARQDVPRSPTRTPAPPCSSVCAGPASMSDRCVAS